jgi:hypothetical protein
LNELIFCAKDVSSQQIISWMNELSETGILFKIAQPDSPFLIGSNSSDTNGEYYTIDSQNISKESAKRNKRTFDFITSLLFICLFPFLQFMFKNKIQFIKNMWHTLNGKKSLVGYDLSFSTEHQLPKIKKGILNVSDSNEHVTSKTKSNLLYAKNYKVYFDIEILLKNFLKLDRI